MDPATLKACARRAPSVGRTHGRGCRLTGCARQRRVFEHLLREIQGVGDLDVGNRPISAFHRLESGHDKPRI